MALVIENRVWDQAELMPREELAALQARRLRETVAAGGGGSVLPGGVPEAGITAESIRTAADVRKLPLTTKEDLAAALSAGFCGCRGRRSRDSRVVGDDGEADVCGVYEGGPGDVGGFVRAVSGGGGVAGGHFVHIAFGYGLFTGGFGLHYGVERVGAAVVPAAGAIRRGR